MDNIFSLRPYITSEELRDAIYLRITKAKSIISYLMADLCDTRKKVEILPYGAVLALDGFIDEIEYLGDMLEKIRNDKPLYRKHLG